MSPRTLTALRCSLCLAAQLAPAAAPAQLLRRASDAVHTGSSEPRRDRNDRNPPSRSSSTPSSSSSPGRDNRWFRSRAFLPCPYAWGYQGYAAPVPTAQRSGRGVAVIIEAQHQCMSTRGIHKTGVGMVTSRMLGVFRTDGETRRELLSMINSSGSPSAFSG